MNKGNYKQIKNKGMKTKQMQVAENLTVNIIPNSENEFLMTSKEVAFGYGISKAALFMCKERNRDELIEGKHYYIGLGVITNCDYPLKTNDYNMQKQVIWTKRGIVRLGFFIKSERAKMFRDWAEDLVVSIVEQAQKAEQLLLFPETPKRRHNRLTPERMIDILADIAKIENSKLRLSLVNKLTNGI